MAAPCGTWDANFIMSQKSGEESSAFAYGWDTVSECDSFTFDHYEICRDADTSTAPSTPASADACEVTVGDISITAADDWVHRSYRDYAATIFACQNVACTEYYGDGTYGSTVTDSGDSNNTAREVWVTEDVTSLSDSDRVIDDSGTTSGVSASAALFYPTGTTHAGKLGIWFSYLSGDDSIGFKRATTAGQLDWNTTTSWTSLELVGEGTGSTAGTGDYTDPTHPWVVATTDGTNDAVRMYLHTQEDAADPHIIELESDGDEGSQSDFALECQCTGSCTCTESPCTDTEYCDWSDDTNDGVEASVAICADSSASCDHLAGARHGRIMWDYIYDGPVDLSSDNPMMVFTGEPDDADCTKPGGDPDDIYLATWDDSTSSWDVELDGSGCPESQLDDYHDPGIIPLPGGEFKMYVRETGTYGSIRVYYWNGTSWESGTDRDIVMYLDGGMTDYNDCFSNPDTVVWKSGNDILEMMFAKAYDDSLVDDRCFDDSGIIYLEHTN